MLPGVLCIVQVGKGWEAQTWVIDAQTAADDYTQSDCSSSTTLTLQMSMSMTTSVRREVRDKVSILT